MRRPTPDLLAAGVPRTTRDLADLLIRLRVERRLLAEEIRTS
jgi:hypothetical protein